MRMFIATICKSENLGTLCLHSASVTSSSKQAVIDKAIEKKQEFERSGNGPYSIFIGELFENVVMKPNYVLHPIQD